VPCARRRPRRVVPGHVGPPPYPAVRAHAEVGKGPPVEARAAGTVRRVGVTRASPRPVPRALLTHAGRRAALCHWLSTPPPLGAHTVTHCATTLLTPPPRHTRLFKLAALPRASAQLCRCTPLKARRRASPSTCFPSPCTPLALALGHPEARTAAC
jgi:hypothetical protein